MQDIQPTTHLVKGVEYPEVDVVNLRSKSLEEIKAMALVFSGNMLAGGWPKGKDGEKLSKQMSALQVELQKRGEPLILPTTPVK